MFVEIVYWILMRQIFNKFKLLVTVQNKTDL